MTLMQLLAILRARWFSMAVVFALVVGGAVTASLLLPKKYTATTQVVIDMKPDPVAGVMMAGMLAPGYIATQVDIATSERLAGMVVDKLRIVEDPVAIQQFQDEMEGRGSIRQFYAQLLLKGLEVKPSRESSLLNIAFTGSTPEFAAVVANAFAQAYVDTNIEMRVEPAKQYRQWFTEQSAALRERIDQAQRRLIEYQRENKITSADERLDVETAKLQEVSSQLNVAIAQTVDARKRSELAEQMVARGTIGELPEVLQNSLVQQLKANQASLEAKLREQGAVLGAQHPDIRRMSEDLKGTRERAQQEALTVAASLGRTYTVARQREAELRSALDRQRTRVLSLRGNRDQLTSLERDVENAQKAYETVALRATQSGLESQSSQANLFILKPAEAPNRHSSPKLLLNTAVSIVLGGLLALGYALLRELLARRVRGPQDLMQATGAPLLGRIQTVPRRQMRDPRNRKVPLRTLPVEPPAARGGSSIEGLAPGGQAS